MRKLVKLLFGLFALYILTQILANFFSNGYEVKYKIENEYVFDVKEKKVKNIKNEIDSYYFEINVNGTDFSIQTFEKLGSGQKILSDIKYYEDGQYKCVLPVAKNNELFSDIICKRENTYYSYNSIKGTDSKLDEFVSNLDVYDSNKYINSEEILKDSHNIIAYDNFPDNFYVALEQYKGLYYATDKIVFGKKVLFQKDIYQKDISAFIKKYYVVADYNEEYEFHDFYLIDIESGNQSKITSNKAISMYSYINGVVDNSVYLFDTSSKKQYEINIKTKTVIEVGNENTGIKYYNNGIWETRNAYDALNQKMYFNYYTVDSNFNGQIYSRVDKFGGENTGYYYLYKSTSSGYQVYRVNVQNMNNITYLFTTSDIQNIIYLDSYIIYKDGTYIKYYHDLTGSRNLLECDEIGFNSSLKFHAYKR